jgi:GNAT superfamily N-acetyltransferase
MAAPIQQSGEGAPRPPVRVPEVWRMRCRSFCFLERNGARWTAFLITFLLRDGYWRGYFTFRSASSEAGEAELRTADLFVEETEAEVDQRARGLGRPLLSALLESALDTAERRRGFTPQLQRWFRDLLAERAGQHSIHDLAAPTLEELRSIYESYRLDQVAHLIALIEADEFREMVEILLDGRRIDFRERDRFQLAMSVVQDLERRLPLPPFEVWVQDYLANPGAYRRYAFELHGEGPLPDEGADDGGG